MKYGGVYKDGGDYALRMGIKYYFLSDGITDIEEDVEIADGEPFEFISGYCLQLDKRKHLWKIKDTGHKNCKHVLASGSYTGNFEKSIEPILKVFK